jgi:hypothetical protein
MKAERRRHLMTFFYIFLFLKNTLLFRRLHIRYVGVGDPLMIEGDRVQLNWNVQGCYKISIAGHGAFRGDVSRVSIRVPNDTRSLRVSFYGIVRKETRKIALNVRKVSFANDFAVNCNIPHHLYLDENCGELEIRFEELRVQIARPKPILELISLNGIDQYNPKQSYD